MENPLFVNLLRLYSSHRKKTPWEDFFTEVLAGVLQSDQQLLNDYAHEILKLPEDQFSLLTQARYSDSIIDMVFVGKRCICFVENKIDSPEGYGQLSKYAQSHFIEPPNQFEAIATWFIEKMEQWAKFMRQDKIVNWKLPPK